MAATAGAEKLSNRTIVSFCDRVLKYFGLEKVTFRSISNLLSALGQRMMDSGVISLVFPPSSNDGQSHLSD
ncbi:hypothetical protein INR49_023498 [Caranx melampygus]|nr:hypothetical protein INR49_023498 [Caranx melampygus]